MPALPPPREDNDGALTRTCPAREVWRPHAGCNYGGGAQVAVDNRTNRQLVEHYLEVIEQQQDIIDQLTRRLEERDQPSARPMPVIC